jgi:predicted dehydrogenase
MKQKDRTLRFALFGTGFWGRYQLAGWQEAPGVKCVALYNRTLSRAEVVAQELDVPAVYDDAEKLLKNEKLDFVDIATAPGTHKEFVHLAAKYKLPVICQKPMAWTLRDAKSMLKACKQARVPYFVHENWRWQTAIRQVRKVLNTNCIGTPFRARISHFSGFPVFSYEPNLKEWENYILMDMGPHVLDVARFLFGEAQNLYCQTQRIHKDIKGADVATIMMKMEREATVTCEIGYPQTFLENDMFPETLIFIEGDKGSLELARGYWIRTTTKSGTKAKRFPSPHYSWADPAYDIFHASIVDCNRHMADALRGNHR